MQVPMMTDDELAVRSRRLFTTIPGRDLRRLLDYQQVLLRAACRAERETAALRDQLGAAEAKIARRTTWERA
jgi:hypothetical protein